MQVSTLDPCGLTASPTHDQMDAARGLLATVEAAGYGVALRMRHIFTPGVYSRLMFIPAGTVLSGACHKVEHVVSFSGDITVWHEGQAMRLTGFHTLTSTPGAQRIGHAHADTWCVGHFANPTEERDIRVLERMFVEDADQLQCNRLPHVQEDTPCLV
jgi:hypothetical protein